MGTRLISTVQQGELQLITCSRPAPGALLGVLDWRQEGKQPERLYREGKPPPETRYTGVMWTRDWHSSVTRYFLGPHVGKQDTEMPRSRTSTDKHYVCGLENQAGYARCTSNKQPQT